MSDDTGNGNGNGNGNVTSHRRRHLSEDMALRWFRSLLTPKERAFFVRHLLGECGRCRELVFKLGIQTGILLPDEQDTLKALALEAPDVGTRRLLGLAQWAYLQSVDDNRHTFINSHPEFQQLGLFERLVEVSRLEMRQDPFKAYEAANLAGVVARTLNVPSDLRNDYLATAAALMGNAARLSADFDGAEIAFAAAWALREEGTSDPLVDALIYRYEGAYYSDLGRYDEADHALNNALIEYAHAGDEHLQGRTLLSLAAVASYHDSMQAIQYLGRANVLYDPLREPLLLWCGIHIEVWALNEMNRPEVALELLEQHRGLYRHFGRTDVWVRLRGWWVEGRIAFNLGRHQDAERIFTMLFESLDREGKHPVDLTLIAVDLLQAISVQEGRGADVIRFSDELLPLLRGLGLHDQGRAVMLMLRQALITTALDNVAWQRVKGYFRAHWYNPLAEPLLRIV
jgi:tetratricopeptide (TPR) repeat protein